MKVQNKLITESSEFHLTVIGLYLYVLINSQLNINKTFSTNRDVLIQQLEGVFGAKRSTIVAKLNSALDEILEKTPLIVSNAEWQSATNKDLLIFSMPENRENHTQVPYEVITSVNDVDMLYIYVCVARWANKGDGFFKCPYTRWAKLFQCSERTAKSKVKEAILKKLIFVNRGNYIGGSSKKQDINEYTIKPIAHENKTLASIAYEKAESSKYFDGVLGYDKTPLAQRKGFFEYANQVEIANWAFENTDKNSYPENDHYYAVAIVQRRQKQHVLAPEELKLLEVAQRRIKVLSTNSRLKMIVEDKVERAKKLVNQLSSNDILFITYQDKIKNNKSATTTSVNGFEQVAHHEDEMFGED